MEITAENVRAVSSASGSSRRAISLLQLVAGKGKISLGTNFCPGY
jgi:hypothetical protein